MNCGLCAKELEIIQEILSRYEAIQSAVLFGSSVTGNFKTASDIDIALKGAITIKLIAKIKAEFEDSTLPFFVDIVDYAKADNALKNEIDMQGVMLYPHFKATTNTWQRVKLGEVAEIMSGGTPKTSVPEYWGGDIAWLTPKDLTGYTSIYISKGERFTTQEGLKNSSATIMPKGTILLSSRAPIGYVAIAQNDICTNQGFKSLICKKEKANNLFIYYWIKKNTQYLQSLGTGTTFGELSKNVVQNIEISLPPLETQQRIAEILSSLDDKIDLLHRQNKTLESLALTLFRHTFIENPKNPNVPCHSRQACNCHSEPALAGEESIDMKSHRDISASPQYDKEKILIAGKNAPPNNEQHSGGATSVAHNEHWEMVK